jgi:hypothetical protein
VLIQFSTGKQLRTTTRKASPSAMIWKCSKLILSVQKDGWELGRLNLCFPTWRFLPLFSDPVWWLTRSKVWVSSFDRVNFFLNQNGVVLVKQKSTDRNQIFDRVLPGQQSKVIYLCKISSFDCKIIFLVVTQGFSFLYFF